MPVTNFYFKNVPNDIKIDIDSVAHYTGLDLLNLKDSLSIFNRYELFKDYGHLNKIGDSIVIDYLAQFFNK